MGKKRRDGRAARRGNNTSPSNAGARNSGGGLQQTTTGIRYNNGIHNGVYEGEIQDGVPHGTGKLEFDNGDVYDGEWKDGNRHRKGIYRFADGELYSGELVDGNPHGRGDYKWADGRVYEGEFANGQQHGLGKMTWPSGLAYEGEWVAGRKHGRGTMKLPTGETREGIWMKGKFAKRKLRSQRSQQQRAENNVATKSCENCGVDDYHYRLQVCTGCNLALYCSEACQKAASRSHRRICNIISELPSRDADRLTLEYDRDKMVDLDAGLRYATKHMSNLKHLQINLREMANGDALKLSTKQLSSLLRSKKGALDSLFLTSDDRHPEVHVTFEHDTVWKELYRLKQLRLDYMSFDDVQPIHDIINQQRNTLMVLSIPYLDIDWHKAKCRRSVAQAVSSCKHLVKLDLQGCGLMDSDLKIMLQDLPSLRILRLTRDTRDNHQFTDNTLRGVRKIFEGCPHLRSFYTSTRKLSYNDFRSLLDIAPQLLHLSLSDEVGLSDGELGEVIEATGDALSANTREKYDRRKDILDDFWSKEEDPDVANEWAGVFEG
ncbi:hypothetical protein ACHAXT_011357 [Thalassiosira profunda]